MCSVVSDPLWRYSLPGSSVHGTVPARKLEWVTIASSRGFSQPRDRTCLFNVYSFLDNLSSYRPESSKPTVSVCWLLAMMNYFLISFYVDLFYLDFFSLRNTLWSGLWMHPSRVTFRLGSGITWGVSASQDEFCLIVSCFGLRFWPQEQWNWSLQLVWYSRLGFRNLRKDLFCFIFFSWNPSGANKFYFPVLIHTLTENVNLQKFWFRQKKLNPIVTGGVQEQR